MGTTVIEFQDWHKTDLDLKLTKVLKEILQLLTTGSITF